MTTSPALARRDRSEHGPACSLDGDDLRQRPPDWAQLEHLIEGARDRGFSHEQCEYLASCIGISWAKATFTAERSR